MSGALRCSKDSPGSGNMLRLRIVRDPHFHFS